MKNKILIILSATIFSLCSYSLAQAGVCRGKVNVTGSKALTWLGARSKARIRWRFAARKRYGRRFGYWTNAKNRRYRCGKRGIWKRCRISANPCKL